MKDFVHLHGHSAAELLELVAEARRLKASPLRELPLAGKSVALCFLNPSLRTRVSFETAVAQLGGHPIALAMGQATWKLATEDGAVMDGGEAEHAKEAVGVLSRMCAAIALRAFPDGKSWAEDVREPALSAFRKHAGVPLINLESALGHPCQALADLMTVTERMKPQGKRFLLAWAPHVRGLPQAVPASAAEIAAAGGMDVTIARPAGFDLAPEIMARIEARCRETGARLEVTDDVAAAYEGADVVYAKSWGPLEPYGEPLPADPAFRKRWICDGAKMSRTNGAPFLHCLPVRRNLVVADEVLDGPHSAVLDQAENRLHTAKAVLLRLLSRQPALQGVRP